MPRDLPTSLLTTQALIAQFLSSLESPRTTTVEDAPTNPPALPLLEASTRALHAQTTKLSLLAVTAPFTPSAVASVLGELNNHVFPSLLTATTLCTPERFTQGFSEEAVLLTRGVFRGLDNLVRDVEGLIPNQGDFAFRTKPEKEKERERILAATGRVQGACDELTQMAAEGLGGFVARKTREWRATVRDALEELEEWDPDDEDEDDLFGVLEMPRDEHDDSEVANGHEYDEQKLAPHQKNALLKVAKAIEKLYVPISRKLQTTLFSSQALDPTHLAGLSLVLSSLKDFPDTVDDLAEAMYTGNLSQVRRSVSRFKQWKDKGAYSAMERSWSGKKEEGDKDEFTIWQRKWWAVVSTLIEDAIACCSVSERPEDDKLSDRRN